MNGFGSDNHATIHPAVLEYERRYDRSVGGWREEGTLRFGSVELEVGRLWHSLILLLRPRMVLETGTFRGYSTSCIASALSSLGGDRRVITIDPDPKEDLVWAGSSLESVITFRRQLSQEAFGELYLARTRFDMLVLDSDHHYDTIISELMLYEPLLNVGGTILLHDTLFFDGVGAATRQLLDNPRFEGLTLDSPRHEFPGHRCPGIAIVRKKRDGYPEIYHDRNFTGWNVGDPFTPPLLRVHEAHERPKGPRRRPRALLRPAPRRPGHRPSLYVSAAPQLLPELPAHASDSLIVPEPASCACSDRCEGGPHHLDPAEKTTVTLIDPNDSTTI